jgi:hypothetical protein
LSTTKNDYRHPWWSNCAKEKIGKQIECLQEKPSLKKNQFQLKAETTVNRWWPVSPVMKSWPHLSHA